MNWLASQRCEDFLYIDLKAGPAGGLRPPSGPAATPRLPGSRPNTAAVEESKQSRGCSVGCAVAATFTGH